MLDLTILSDKPITPCSCSSIIKENFKSLILYSDDDETLYMKKLKSGFELWYSPEDSLKNPDYSDDKILSKCPNKEAFITNLCYTSKTVAAKLISILKPLYGNMWIQSDEEDDWFGTADDFINIYCKQ